MIKEFFVDNKIGISFELFGITHIVLMLSLILSIFLLHKNRDKLKSLNSDIKRKYSLYFICFLFFNMLIYYLELVYFGNYNWRTNLPLHFCFISGYLYMYSVYYEKKELYKNIYFFAFIGPIPAIILPELKSSFDSFLFYQQVISHHFFLIFSMYTFYAYDININKKDAIKSFMYAMSIFGIMYIFNSMFDTNYIMQNRLPNHVINLMPFLKEISNPMYILIITGIMMYGLAYIPIYYKNKNK